MQLKFKHYFSGFVKNTINDLGNLSGKANRLLLYTSFSLLFIGCKLWVIYYYGNATPFWDQWDGEGANLYNPFLNGTLSLKQLTHPHNEHRILTTRLLNLLLLYINKLWNPLLQMVVNAGLHLMAVLLLNKMIAKTIGVKHLPGLLACSLVLFCMPFGWENTLGGFQSQFYFVTIFSIAAIWYTMVYEPFSTMWWGGIICGVLAFFSLASGALVFGAMAVIGLFIYFSNVRKTSRQLIASILLAILFVTGIVVTPVLAHQAVYKARNIEDFYYAMRNVLSWPISFSMPAAILRNFPMVIFIILLLWKRPGINDRRWFLFACCIWSIIIVTSMAYGRAAYIMSPRYKDLYLVSVLLNIACFISLIDIYWQKWRKLAVIALGGWTAFVLCAFILTGIYQLPDELVAKKGFNLAQERNTKNYVATGEINHLLNKPEWHIPLPYGNALAQIIELPGIREILPFNIRTPLKPVAVESNVKDAFIANGYAPSTPVYPDSLYSIWGSYNVHRDSTIGELVLRFKIPLKGTKIRIPVAGYPLNNGMKIQIEQKGQRKTLEIADNPGKVWKTAYTNINSNDFSIHISDSSTTSWAAIGAPVVIGRFDDLTNRLLSRYYVFFMLGLVIAIILMIQGGLYTNNQ